MGLFATAPNMKIDMRKQRLFFTLMLFVATITYAANLSPASQDAAKVVAAAHLKTGQQLAAAGKAESAEKEFTIGLASFADSSALYLGRGLARFQQKHYPESIADFDQYLARVANDSKIVFERGIAKSLLKPEDVPGACADIFTAKNGGLSMKGIGGLDKYCKGQPNW
jgi:tetratricopeptide (TPR) repeat protein